MSFMFQGFTPVRKGKLCVVGLWWLFLQFYDLKLIYICVWHILCISVFGLFLSSLLRKANKIMVSGMCFLLRVSFCCETWRVKSGAQPTNQKILYDKMSVWIKNLRWIRFESIIIIKTGKNIEILEWRLLTIF